MSWIPVEERLPGRGYWLVTLENGTVMSGYHIASGTWYDDEDCDDIILGVIAWQPLPEPYKKPRRFVVRRVLQPRVEYVVDYDPDMNGNVEPEVATNIPTREAAEKIADIYEEAYRGE